MSRTLKLRLHQSQALATVPQAPRPINQDPTTTEMLPYAPPQSMREALLTGSRWISLDVTLRDKELERRRKQELLEEEGCGALEHLPTDADYHGSGRWENGEYLEDPDES